MNRSSLLVMVPLFLASLVATARAQDRKLLPAPPPPPTAAPKAAAPVAASATISIGDPPVCKPAPAAPKKPASGPARSPRLRVAPMPVKGDPGPPGPPGPAPIVETEPAGTNCVVGGVKITDGDHNAVYICNGAPGPAGPKGEDGEDGDDAVAPPAEQSVFKNLALGVGYRVSQVWASGRPTAFTYSPEALLRFYIGPKWELTLGGTFISGGDRATLLHGSVDAYVFPGLDWLAVSLGIHAQWYGIRNNLAKDQVILAAPGLAFTPYRSDHVDIRCDLAGLLGVDGFIGGSSGNGFAGGYTASCGVLFH